MRRRNEAAGHKILKSVDKHSNNGSENESDFKGKSLKSPTWSLLNIHRFDSGDQVPGFDSGFGPSNRNPPRRSSFSQMRGLLSAVT